MDTFKDIVALQQKLTKLEHQYWEDHVLFSFSWWLLLFLLIAPWLLWWKLVDKKRIKEMLLYGFYVIIISSILDDIGIASALWAYPHQLLQIGDRLHAIDLAALPCIYMLIYQYFPKWKSYWIATIIFAFCFAFIFEPILVWLEIYKPLSWKFIYSFPIYFIIAVFGKWFVEKIK
ncbi:MAG: hypothetical protein MJB12_18795 [Firmicutes bacterium]|nr:hypothetical protein [Bacillota bacterium]